MKRELTVVKIEEVNKVLVATINRVLGVLHKNLMKKIKEYESKFSTAETSALSVKIFE